MWVERGQQGLVFMRISIITIFPEAVRPYLDASMMKRAQEAGVKLEAINLREFSTDRHRTTDDTPYGGEPMVMKVEPFFAPSKS